MTAEAQLEREARTGRYAAAAAFAAVVLIVVSFVVYQSGVTKAIHFGGHTIKGSTSNAQLLLHIHDSPTRFAIAAAVSALALVPIALLLSYLLAATRARLPQVPRGSSWIVAIGPIFAGAVTFANQLRDDHLATQFAHGARVFGKAGDKQATHLLQHGSGVFLQYLGIPAGIALAFSFVLVGLYGMRAGLLSRGMGIFGIVVGALLFLPFGEIGVILEVFWLAAVGLMCLDRWPGGRGPAWSALEPIPWPSAADRRRQMAEEHEAAKPEPEPVAAPQPSLPASQPRSRKRKRKRR